MEKCKEENRQLELSLQRLRKQPSAGLEAATTNELLLAEQQRQFEEDMQAELIESRERTEALEQRCQELEEQLVRQLEVADLERLRALETLRKQCDDRESVLVQQIKELQLQLQLQRRNPANSLVGATNSTTSTTAVGNTNPQGGPTTQSAGQLVEATTTVDSKTKESGSKLSGSDKVNCTPASEPKVKETDSALILAQQLPPLPKFSGEGQEESFPEWHAQFELMAEACKWSIPAKLVHLTTRLRGQAFSFYRSCSKQQKSDYESLVGELTRRFTPVRIPSVQTSLFHERKQKQNESVDMYAQDLKTLFYKAYPKVQQSSEVMETMGRTVLTSQFVAGLLPELKSKVAGNEGEFEHVLVKARFEEAKLRDLSGGKKTQQPASTPHNRTSTSEESVPTQRRPQHGQQRCKKCHSPHHIWRQCPLRDRAEPKEAQGRKNSNRQVSAVTSTPPATAEEEQQRDAAVETVLSGATATMYGVTFQFSQQCGNSWTNSQNPNCAGRREH